MDGLKNKDRKRLSVYSCIFLLGILITVFLTAYITSQEVQLKKQTLLHTVEVYGARTEALLDSLFHKTDVLESVIINGNGKVSQEVFNDLAKSLSNGVGIRAIQYLPDGVVTYCYPIEGNEEAIGGNVFENLKRKSDAALAFRTKEISLSGPYELTQGGLGLIARNPIYLTDSAGEEKFWGFSSIVLDLPEALEPIMLSEIEKEGYEYRLHCVLETGERVTIVESEHFPPEGSTDFKIQVPNHVWTLSMIPKEGWIEWRKVILELLGGICVSGLCAMLLKQSKIKEKELREFASTDELTGLFNRRRLLEYLDIRCRDEHTPFMLLYMDLNRFKEINDTLGHYWGDVVLREAAKRIKGAIIKEGLLARIGGDEFVAILEHNSTEKDFEEKAADINHVLSEPFLLNGIPKNITISIGYAFYPGEGNDYNEIMKLADKRMYEEKEKNR